MGRNDLIYVSEKCRSFQVQHLAAGGRVRKRKLMTVRTPGQKGAALTDEGATSSLLSSLFVFALPRLRPYEQRLFDSFRR